MNEHLTSNIPNSVLMIRPKVFGFNEETAKTNSFQRNVEADQLDQLVLQTFDEVVLTLESHGILVYVFDDKHGVSPDALFPNNWISQMPDGTVTIFSMATVKRQTEVQEDVVHFLLSRSGNSRLIDLRDKIQAGQYLEGTGSIVFDYDHKIAYANISRRTDATLFESYCKSIGYTPFSFGSFDLKGQLIYHTNVMMAITQHYAIVNLDSIENMLERLMLKNQLERTGKIIIEIKHDQTVNFAGNVMELCNADGESHLIISETAKAAFSGTQIAIIEKFSKMVTVDVSIIEQVGGGGVRCMLAGLFL